jgi:uncharacterized protein
MQLRRSIVWIAGLGLAAWAGCSKPKHAVTDSAAAAAPPAPAPLVPGELAMTNAQPKLPTVKLWLGGAELTVELATTPRQIATGMMFRQTLAETEGMLFIFNHPHRTSFYMRNTTVPLTCAYIDREGIIREIHDMKPLDETPIDADSNDIQFVLEVKQGWFQRNHVAVGTLLRTEQGSLLETFFRRR